jgi:hypothetical protein
MHPSSLFAMIATLTTIEVAAMYCIMSLCFFGGVRAGKEVRYALRLSKASLASSVHSNLPVFFSNLKKGNPFSPSHDMKRLRAAMQPVNFCTLWHIKEGPPLLLLEFAWYWPRFHNDWKRIRVVVIWYSEYTLVWVQFPLPFLQILESLFQVFN